MSNDLYCYFGHHKCATTWVNDILRGICGSLGLRLGIVSGVREFGGDLPAWVEEQQVDFLAYINADYDHVRKLGPFRGFHVVRDPRDVVVSGYFSHRHSHPTDGWPQLESHRAELEQLPKAEGLMLEMQTMSKQVLGEMGSWDYGDPRILELQMEDLTARPQAGFERVLGHLGLELPPGRLAEIIENHSFERKSGGRRKGEEDVTSHYRKGVAGDWVNHFEPRHRQYFAETFPYLLGKLGYPESPPAP